MKQAVLSPLLKKPLLDHELYPNLCPVSNLKFISKVIEKVASVRILDHLHENGLQECLQSAYKEPHFVILLLLDMSATFDTVDHSILLKRLESCYGISCSALAWFNSYLLLD